MIFTNIDYFIIVLSLLSGLTFIFLWIEKLHRFYFWIIVWFIFFVLTNLYIKMLWHPEVFNIVVPDSSFLILNKGFILSFLAAFIPVFWIILILSEFISFKVSDNKWASFLFWMLVPFFLLSIFIYISVNSIVVISFVDDLLSFLSDISNIVVFLTEKSYLSLYLLVFLVSFRITFWIIISFLVYLSRELYKSIKSENKDKK